MFNWFHLVSFLVGIAFAMFLLPWILSFLGVRKRLGMKAAAA